VRYNKNNLPHLLSTIKFTTSSHLITILLTSRLTNTGLRLSTHSCQLMLSVKSVARCVQVADHVIRRYDQEDYNLNLHSHGNLKPCIAACVLSCHLSNGSGSDTQSTERFLHRSYSFYHPCTPSRANLLMREANHSHITSADVNNAWSYTSTPSISLHGVVLNELYFWTLSIVWCLKKIEE
jgi:hypothetical protein